MLAGAFTLGVNSGAAGADAPGAAAAATSSDAAGAGTQREDPMRDYVVELSEAAKELARAGNPFTERLAALTGDGSAEEDDESDDPVQQQMEDLQRQIERIQQEIDEIRGRALDEDVKQEMIAVKQAELTQYQAQMAQLLQQREQASQLAAQGASGASGAFYSTGSLT